MSMLARHGQHCEELPSDKDAYWSGLDGISIDIDKNFVKADGLRVTVLSAAVEEVLQDTGWRFIELQVLAHNSEPEHLETVSQKKLIRAIKNP